MIEIKGEVQEPGLDHPTQYHLGFNSIELARKVRNEITDAIRQQGKGSYFLPKGIWCKACSSFTSEEYFPVEGSEEVTLCPNCNANKKHILIVTLEDTSAS